MNHANDNNPSGLTFLSVCSGIEAASVAWHPLGWRAVAFSEIEKFPSAVLAHHYPTVPNLGDFTKIDVRTLPRVDILCGGTPCQAFSVAGLRQSLADERGNLSLEFVRLAHELAASNGLRNVVWENVVGVLSTKDNAFGCFLAGLVGADSALIPCDRPEDGKSNRYWKWSRKECRHIVSWPTHGMVAGPKGRAAWSVKDGQFFRVAQRRRRVLLVADFGNGADPSAVLFEPESVPRDTAPSREAGKGIAGATAQGFGSSVDGYWREGIGPLRAREQDSHESLAVYAPEIARCVATREGSSQDFETTTMVAVAATLTATYGEQSGQDMLADGMLSVCGVHGDVAHTLKAEGADASEDGTGRGTPIVAFDCKGTQVAFTTDGTMTTLRSMGHSGSHQNAGGHAAVAFAENSRDELRLEGGDGQTVGTLGAGGGKPGQGYPAVLSGAFATSAVRRLTPLECERLQGFPEVRKNLYIQAWKQHSFDHHQSDANAETQSRKSLKFASNADASESKFSAPSAASHSNASRLDCEKPADVHVLINFERNDLQLHSPKNLNWSVSIAERLNSSLLPMQVGDFARLIAHIFTIQEKITLAGKAASPANTSSSSHHLSGKPHNVRYGRENSVNASDATLFMKELDAFMKSITSKAGLEIDTLEQRLQTSLSFATNAISSCIPATMLLENSFSLTIEGVRGYTNIPWRNSHISPDGPRYKALGNSWAVPKFAWLGRRIQALMPVTREAANDNTEETRIADAA